MSDPTRDVPSSNRERFTARLTAWCASRIARRMGRSGPAVPAVIGVALCLAHGASAQSPVQVATDGGPAWAAVQQALGGRGTMQPGSILKFGFPRSDLRVTVDGVQLRPALALGSWLAFKRMGTSPSAATIVMGDLVLTEAEVGPVMLALQQAGVEQSALHHHVLHESPRVLYMHVVAHGNAATLAATLRTALGLTATPLPASSPGAPTDATAPPALDLDTAGIARALGRSGRAGGGVYQVSVPRRERIIDHGMVIPPAMGVATAINFQSTGGGKAAITGDFVMTAAEVNPVIRALRAHGIQVTALHGHMLTERPRLFFMHFWANDDAVALARGLRAALDAMRVPSAR